jgi:hypothetical protein
VSGRLDCNEKMGKVNRISIFLMGLIFSGLTIPHLAWSQDLSLPQSIKLIMGTPLTFGFGFEYEYYLTNSHSLALEAGFIGLLASDIERDTNNVIEVGSEFELDIFYRYYVGKKAPGGYMDC